MKSVALTRNGDFGRKVALTWNGDFGRKVALTWNGDFGPEDCGRSSCDVRERAVLRYQ